MSVTRTADATVYPIFREPGLPQNNPSILGRVYGMSLQAMDASGGSLSTYFRVPNLSAVFGSHALLQIDTYSQSFTGATLLNNTYFDFQCNGSEYDIDGASFVTYHVEHFVAAGGRGPVGPIVPKALLRGAAADIYVIMVATPNVATGGGFYQSFHALVIDERMI